MNNEDFFMKKTEEVFIITKIAFFVSIFFFALFPFFSAVYSGETVRGEYLDYRNVHYTENLYNFIYSSYDSDDVVSFTVYDILTGLGLTIFILYVPICLAYNLYKLFKLKKHQLIVNQTKPLSRILGKTIADVLFLCFFAAIIYTARAELEPVRGLALGGIKLTNIVYLPASGTIVVGTILIILANLSIAEMIVFFVTKSKQTSSQLSATSLVTKKLLKLKQLLDSNVITIEEFEKLKQQIMSSVDF